MLTIQAQLWQDCNINCTHCWRDAKFENLKLDTDKLYEQLIIFLNKYSKYHDEIRLSLTWWEIFLYFDRFKKLIWLLDLYKNLKIWLLTNWLLINDEHTSFLDKYKDRLIIQISIDWVWQIHDNIRWKWNFEKSINKIVKLKQKGFVVRAQAVIRDFNYDNLLVLLKLFIKFKIHLIWFRKMLPVWRRKDKIDNDLIHRNEKLYNFYDKLLKLVVNLDSTWKITLWCDAVSAVSKKTDYVRLVWDCWIHNKRVLWIEFNWDITLCARLPISIWNIYKDNLLDVYENNYLKKYYEIYNISDDCRKCEHLNFCKWWDLCEIYSYYWNLDKKKSLICVK